MQSIAISSQLYHRPPQHPSSIDPILPIDPAILGEASNNLTKVSSPISSPSLCPSPHFEQAPQGDPFAQAPLIVDIDILQQRMLSPPRPLKRKRKRPARRDEECSFCRGHDGSNKHGYPEQMVSCYNCGRSGHPSCLGIESIANVVHTYDWYCIECKTCEVCLKKGHGERMLFCDACDRGWHMDCLDPPLDETPNGSWICPNCGDLPHLPTAAVSPAVLPPPLDTPSSPGPSTIRVSNPRGRAANSPSLKVRDVSEPRMAGKRGRKPKDVKGKGRARGASTAEGVSSPAHRVTSSPEVPGPGRRKVRLVVRKPRTVIESDEEEEDPSSPTHMFEDILTPEQYSAVNTHILDSDKVLFNKAKTRAESKLGPPIAPPLPSGLMTPLPTPSTPAPIAGPSFGPGLLHSLRSRHAPHHHRAPSADTPTTPAAAASSAGYCNGNNHSPSHPPRIRMIRFGEYDVDTWYDAPFPEEYASVPDGKLWMCEFCLKYMKSRYQSTRHKMKCKARHPPGDEIYRDGTISIFEVDGRRNKIYCQNLCLLSKMFLDHKSLFYDVEPFLFYVMTEVDRLGARFVGYFSKEKHSPKDYNVSCIMTLPVRQRRGFGNILIDFSYLLSKKEERVGTPERPLSGLGALAYKQYWAHTVKLFLHTARGPLRMEDISKATSMTLEDIYSTLRDLNYISEKERPPTPARPPPGTPVKYPRGRKNGPGIARRILARTSGGDTKDEIKGPLVIPTEYTISWNHQEVDAYVTAWRAKGHMVIQARFLKWSPFISARETKNDDGEEGGQNAGAGTVEEGRSSITSTKATQNVSQTGSTPKVQDEPSSTVSVDDVEMEDSPEVKKTLKINKVSSSMETEQMEEDGAPAVLEIVPTSDLPRRRLRSGKDARRSAQARSTTSASDTGRRRTLRPRPGQQDTPNDVGNTDEEDKMMEEEEGEGDKAEAEDSDFDSRASESEEAEEEELEEQEAPQTRGGYPRRARASYKLDSEDSLKAEQQTPRPPHKRRRVESSPSVVAEAAADPEHSLSELTRGSTASSPSPSPSPPRRVTRAQAQNANVAAPPPLNGVTNVVLKTVTTRSQAAKPLTLGTRSSSRINGAIRISPPRQTTLKDSAVVNEFDESRVRVTRQGMMQVDALRSAHSEKLEKEKAKTNGTPAPLNGLAFDGNTPLYDDEDALGEEDAEGEEDPDVEEE